MKDSGLVIDQILNGDKEKFRLLIQDCNEPLYRTAIVILKNEEDAEDALQTTYLKAYLHLKDFRREAAFLTWLTRILINECRMMLRRKRSTSSLDNNEILEKPSLTETAMDSLNNKQISQLLEKAVMELPEKYRLVYVVREVNELSTEKTAEALGITEDNVKVRLHRAKSLIRENLLQTVNATELFPFHKTRCQRIADRVMRDIDQLPSAQPV